ncbi:hypothetical protein L0Y46_04535, partial [bacterium]|nr:hypothetical protein [bacterium]
RLKISTIFFAFLAAFSPRTMNSRYVNSFFTSSMTFSGVYSVYRLGRVSFHKLKKHSRNMKTLLVSGLEDKISLPIINPKMLQKLEKRDIRVRNISRALHDPVSGKSAETLEARESIFSFLPEHMLAKKNFL